MTSGGEWRLVIRGSGGNTHTLPASIPAGDSDDGIERGKDDDDDTVVGTLLFWSIKLCGDPLPTTEIY